MFVVLAVLVRALVEKVVLLADPRALELDEVHAQYLPQLFLPVGIRVLQVLGSRVSGFASCQLGLGFRDVQYLGCEGQASVSGARVSVQRSGLRL